MKKFWLVILLLSLLVGILSFVGIKFTRQKNAPPAEANKTVEQSISKTTPVPTAHSAKAESGNHEGETFNETTRLNMRDQLLMAANKPSTEEVRKKIIERADAAIQAGIMQRPYSLQDFETMRARSSTSTGLIENLDEREQFALATADSNAGATLALEMPTIAAAYVLTSDAKYKNHITEQLREIVTWEPLQRPGWTIRSRKDPLPTEGDGVWLATGWLIRAIVDSVQILPNDAIDEQLQSQIDALMDREIRQIASDWNNKIPWYVRDGKSNSNQWVVPVEGLIRACLYQGVERYPGEYEQGVSAMLESFNAQGNAGEFTEGLTYASITVRGMISAAHAMEMAGDYRLNDHPFLQHTGTWFTHHIQPGGFLVNAFDVLNASHSQLNIFGNVFAQIGAHTGNDDTLWAIKQWSLTGNSLDYLIATSHDDGDSSPPLPWAYYPVGTRVVWRNSWEDDATGVWLRGGGEKDFHDHADRGHVNFIIGDKPILIEAGRPPYGTPEEELLYTGLAGHNVLQIGLETKPRSRDNLKIAPITVNELGPDGGDVSIDVSACYPEAIRWIRHVEWDHDEVRIHDEVELQETDYILFRWHLGEASEATRNIADDHISIGDIRIDFQSDNALDIEVTSKPDATLQRSKISEHACVIMQSTEPVKALKLSTVFSLNQ